MNVARLSEGIKAASEQQYSFAGGQGYTFSPLAIKNLQPGTYLIRFVWSDPVKNPDGMLLVSTASVEQNDETVRWMTADTLPAGEGYPGLKQTMDLIEEKGVVEKLKAMGEKTKGIRDAIRKLCAWRRYWMPVFIFAKEVPPAKPGDFSSYIPVNPNEPGAKPLDITLEVNESVKLIAAIIDLFKQYPDADHPQTGRWCRLEVRKNRYTIEAGQNTSQLPPLLQAFAAENYPDLPALVRRWYFKDPAEVCSLIKSQWWAKSLAGGNIVFPDYVPTYMGDLNQELNVGVTGVDDWSAPKTQSGGGSGAGLAEDPYGTGQVDFGGDLVSSTAVEADEWDDGELGEEGDETAGAQTGRMSANPPTTSVPPAPPPRRRAAPPQPEGRPF